MPVQLDLAKVELDLILEILGACLDPHRVEVLAFGSRVTGKAKPTSDLDLAIRSQDPIQHRDLGRIREAMQECNLHVRVDVVDMAKLDPDFLKLVDAEAVHLWP